MGILKKPKSETFKGYNLGYLRIPADFKKYQSEYEAEMLTLPHEKICGIKKWPFQEVSPT